MKVIPTQYVFWSVVAIMFGAGGTAGIFRAYNSFVNGLSEVMIVEKSQKSVAAVVRPKYERGDVPQKTNSPQYKKTTRLLFVGDIMLDRGVLSSIEKHGMGDFNFIFKYATATTQADIAFANLEGPIANSGRDVGSIYSFRMKPEAGEALKTIGIDVLSVANNHAGDWGAEAFRDTLEILREQKILAVGGGENMKEAEAVKILEFNGFRFGFLGFSDVGPNWFQAGTKSPGIVTAKNSSYIRDIVKKHASSTDFLITSFHFGEEYYTEPTLRQIELARAAIDAGAKIVVGHHPHVVQKVEKYNGGIIAYSLGNFVFDQDFSEETMKGGALELLLIGKEVVGYGLREIKISNKFQPIFNDVEE